MDTLERVPKHIAIIMDGNGRWAKNRGVNGLEIINPESEPFTGLASLTNTRVKVYRV